jgi:hypothetical protein
MKAVLRRHHRRSTAWHLLERGHEVTVADRRLMQR